MKCSWCGTEAGKGQLMHGGCLDAKRRVAEAEANPQPKKPRKVHKKTHTAAARSSWSSGSFYLDQLEDFRIRMAKRGIKI